MPNCLDSMAAVNRYCISKSDGGTLNLSKRVQSDNARNGVHNLRVRLRCTFLATLQCWLATLRTVEGLLIKMKCTMDIQTATPRGSTASPEIGKRNVLQIINMDE